MKHGLWISYDLGVKGDYQSLYEWLDSYKAKECGNSVAFLQFEYEHDVVKELKAELEGKVNFSNGNRVYVIFKNKTTSKPEGTFIIGGRKSNPWTGYAPNKDQIIDNM